MAQNLDRLLYYMERKNATDKAALNNENVSLNTLINTANNREKVNVSAMGELIDGYKEAPTQENFEFVTQQIGEMDFIYDNTENFRNQTLQNLNIVNNQNINETKKIGMIYEKLEDNNPDFLKIRQYLRKQYTDRLLNKTQFNDIMNDIEGREKTLLYESKVATEDNVEAGFVNVLKSIIPKGTPEGNLIRSKEMTTMMGESGDQVPYMRALIDYLPDGSTVGDQISSVRDKRIKAEFDSKFGKIKGYRDNYKTEGSDNIANESVSYAFNMFEESASNYYTHTEGEGLVADYSLLHKDLVESVRFFGQAIKGSDAKFNDWLNDNKMGDKTFDTILKDPTHPKHRIVVNHVIDRSMEAAKEDGRKEYRGMMLSLGEIKTMLNTTLREGAVSSNYFGEYDEMAGEINSKPLSTPKDNSWMVIE